MKGFSPFTRKSDRILRRAKRLIRKSVSDTTIDSPTFDPNVSNRKFDKQIKRNIKAGKLLNKIGYDLDEIEQATGAGGWGAAMDWATEPSVRKRDKKLFNKKKK